MPLAQKPQLQTINPTPTPSEKIVKENRPIRTTVDVNGRKIVWRPLSILDQAKLLRAIGAEHARNEPYMNLISAAAMVQSIDGDIGPQPTSMAFAEQRIDWVGDDGFVAIWVENQQDTDERVEEQKDAAAQFRDEVKN